MTKKKSKGKGKGKVKSRKRRTAYLSNGLSRRFFLLILLASVCLITLLFQDGIKRTLSYKGTKISANRLAKRIETLDKSLELAFSKNDINERSTLVVYSVKNSRDRIFVSPHRREFILPNGFDKQKLFDLLHNVTGGFSYGIAVRHAGEDSRSFKVRIVLKGYTTHFFTFFYAPFKNTLRYRVAIVIDDLGYSIDRARELLDLNISISFAVLPHLTYSTEIAEEANAWGRDVLLHLPMEPKGYPDENPGEGSIFLSMSDEEVLEQVNRDLDAIPYIVGVNNHMGSKFSEDREKMSVVLQAVKEKKLFFLDSKTSAKTIGYSLAKEIGLNALDRHIFLDNDKDIEYTLAQFEELIRIAKKRGSAVAIGHPHQTTIEALKRIIGRFEKEGVEVVPLSSLLN